MVEASFKLFLGLSQFHSIIKMKSNLGKRSDSSVDAEKSFSAYFYLLTRSLKDIDIDFIGVSSRRYVLF